ncbi:MAG: alpha/beta hydrolase fold protein [Hyphomicrobiales bacterium]|nr:alpha/beta hydrolase fold protein [Hyphomicrobiales bacterium]
MPLRPSSVETSHGRIAVLESGGGRLPLVLLHGNSMCKEVFLPQLQSAIGDSYRLIAIDLPGHGASANARDPQRTYRLPGYADAVIETLHAMGIERAAFYGWSLGGHIVMEMMSRCELVAGAMLTGSPPLRTGYDALLEGFRPHPVFELIFKERLSADEIIAMADLLAGPRPPACVVPAVKRTDPRARPILLQSILDNGCADERAVLEAAAAPLAFVDGEHEPFANLDYMAQVAAASALWGGGHIRLPGLGHAPALEDPAAFNHVLLRFLRHVAHAMPRAVGGAYKSGRKAAVGA